MDGTVRMAVSRVTVVTPRMRVDVALPSDVAIAELMTSLFALTMTPIEDVADPPGGWCLSRVGEVELDAAKSFDALNVRDGELLLLRPRRDSPPPAIYDEITDAVAVASAEWSPGWAGRLGHHVALTVAAAAMAAAAAGLWSIAETTLAVQLSLGLSVLLTAVAAAVARTGGDRPTAVLLGAAALAPAVIGAVRLVPGGPDADNFLFGSASLLISAVLTVVALGAGAVVFVMAATVGALSAVTFAGATLVDAAPEAFTAAALIGGCTAMLFAPRLAGRLAALPKPLIGPADRIVEQDVDWAQLRTTTTVAQRYLTGLYGGLAVATGGAATLLIGGGGAWAPSLGLTGVLVVLLRARSLTRAFHVLALLVPALIALGVGLLTLARRVPADQTCWLPIGAVVLAVLALVVGVVLPTRRHAPSTIRFLDIVEAVLISALVPLAAGVMNLYQVVRHF